MKTLITVLLFAVCITANAQRNYNVGDTIKVDNDLILIITHLDHANIMDVKYQDFNYNYYLNPEISDYNVGILSSSGFNPPLSGEIAKNMIRIFREVFTKEELDKLVLNATDYSKKGIDFSFRLDKNGNLLTLIMSFWPKNKIIDSIPKCTVGKLYKLVRDGIKFNIRDTGIGLHYVNLRVEFKDVVNGTLDYSNLMRDINKGGYLNYYWKDGKVYSFE